MVWYQIASFGPLGVCFELQTEFWKFQNLSCPLKRKKYRSSIKNRASRSLQNFTHRSSDKSGARASTLFTQYSARATIERKIHATRSFTDYSSGQRCAQAESPVSEILKSCFMIRFPFSFISKHS